MCFLDSTIALYPKTDILKTLFLPMEKIIFKVIFPIFIQNENFKACLPFYFQALETLFLYHSES